MSECPYCTNAFEVNDTCHDEFRMWQGLVGPYYIPTIEDGVLTWTNTGGLPNPNPINIIGAQGNGLYIGGIAETTGDLPETAENGVTWLVGVDEPYEGYVYLNGSWVDIGAVTPGPTGPQGIPGAGVPSGGTTGQVLQKASNTDYQTEWADPASGGDPPGTMLPLMDGTAAVGTARSYAREDHVHPQDSEIAELKTSMTNAQGDITDLQNDIADLSALLWQNASPRSGFAEQTISLNLSGYDFVRIGYLWTAANNEQAIIVVDSKVGNSGKCWRADMTSNGSSSILWYAVRNLDVSTSGVKFYDAKQISTNSPTYTTTNDSNIPQFIYGYKAS